MANRLKADMAGIIFDLGRNLKNGNSIGNVRGKLLALPVFRKGSSISVARPVANGFYASAADKSWERAHIDSVGLGRSFDDCCEDITRYFARVEALVKAGREVLEAPDQQEVSEANYPVVSIQDVDTEDNSEAEEMDQE